jgi:hypothetical protein
MRNIILEIHQALDWGSYYAAIVTSLTLPDICGQLETPNERVGVRYRRWSDAWFIAKYANFLTSDDLYQLRNGVLHAGTMMGPPGHQVNRVGFFLPGANFMHKFHLSGLGGTILLLDARTFCRDMTASVEDWYAAKKNDATVQANLPNVLQLHPEGIFPLIVGPAIIA